MDASNHTQHPEINTQTKGQASDTSMELSSPKTPIKTNEDKRNKEAQQGLHSATPTTGNKVTTRVTDIFCLKDVAINTSAGAILLSETDVKELWFAVSQGFTGSANASNWCTNIPSEAKRSLMSRAVCLGGARCAGSIGEGMCPSHRTAGRNAKIARQELSSIEHRDHALHPLPIAAGRLVCCLRVDPLVHFGFSVIHRILCLVATVRYRYHTAD